MTLRPCLGSVFIVVLVLPLVVPVRSAFGETPDHVIDLWPGDPPGEPMEVGEEADMTKDTDKLIAGHRIIKLGNVSKPQAHVYLPPANLSDGGCVVICPGGGFSILAWDLEGTEVAQWLNTLGIAGVVLKYRVPTRNQEPRWKAPVQDAQRTISLTRHHAERWGIDPEKVAVLGFSAGGVTAFKASVATHRHYEPIDDADAHAFRPNRSILIYAGGLPSTAEPEEGAEDIVDASTPPTFMVHAFDDFVPVAGTANLMLALKRAGVASELHIYDAGGHGYGLRKRTDLPVTHWTDPCGVWLKRAGY